MSVSTRLFVGRVACDDDDTSHVHTAACRYRVTSHINPHMRVGAVDFARARAQHRDLVAALRFCGAVVEQLPFVHGCPDSVFVKDMGLLTDGPLGPRALLARFHHHERVGETEPRGRHLQRRSFHIQSTPVTSSCTFEGGDVVVGARTAFLGIGERTGSGCSSAIAVFLGRKVVPLELVDEHFFHLDTCLGLLDDGTALVAEGALSATSIQTLQQHPGIARVVTIDRDDALQFGLNIVQVGDAIVLNAAAKQTARALRALGKTPVTVDLSEFLLAGGSAACLVSRVHEQRLIVEERLAA